MTINAGRDLAAMRKKVMKQCYWCGKDIEGLSTKKYCSNRCKQANKNAKNKDK